MHTNTPLYYNIKHETEFTLHVPSSELDTKTDWETAEDGKSPVMKDLCSVETLSDKSEDSMFLSSSKLSRKWISKFSDSLLCICHKPLNKP